MKYFLLFCLLSSCACTIFAQTDTTISFYKPSLEELDELKRVDKSEPSVSVAGFTTTTLRESAGIVTLITADDIQRMGAKDLMDILRLVPGFDVSTDILPVLTIRGNGVNEGKALVQLDGHPINDVSNGYAFLFQRFPIANIERIEIIRGAGSAIYGGQAGLAVINIQTKKVSNGNQNTYLSNNTSFTKGGLYRASGDVYSLHKLKGGVELNFAASYQKGRFSDDNFASKFYDLNVENTKYSRTTASNINVGLRYKRLDLRFLQNTFQSTLADLQSMKLNIDGTFLSASYVFDINDKLVLHTKASWRSQRPIFITDVADVPKQLGGEGKLTILELSNTIDTRYLANVYLVYQPRENITISGGTECFWDRSRYLVANTYSNGKDQIGYTNLGLFAEINIRSQIANITIGGRMDSYADIKPIAVPRIAVTRAFKQVHFKALYTEAFKTPTLRNIQFTRENTTLVAERFRLIEFETGIKLFKKLQLNANVYDIVIRDFITRNELSNVSYDYTNLPDVGTQGIEGEARYNDTWGNVQMSYSFYRVSPAYTGVLNGLPTVTPGTPAQKLTLQANFNLHQNIQLNLTFMHITNKFRGSGFVADFVEEFKNEQHLDLYLQYNNFLIKNLSLGAGCYNILNQRYNLISWKKDLLSEIYTTLPQREVVLKIIYHIKS